MTSPHTVHRRELLQVGCSSLLGLGLSSLFAQRAESAVRAVKPKSLLIVYLTGAASHHDTFDMKPDAVPEIRGQFKPIATTVPGLQICELLPELAARAHKYALVRSMSHREDNHLVASHHVLTGHQQPGAFFDKIASRDDWPCYASAVGHLRPRGDGIPCGVHLPTYLMEGPLLWPGQHAGFLGPKHDPVQLTRDPNAVDFRADSMSLPEGIGVGRLEDRRQLLEQVNQQQKQLGQLAECVRLSDQQQLAFSVLTSGKLTQAFEIDREPASLRERYGRHSFGQSLLLARRLIEAGVPVVQANMGRVQNWDHHSNIFTTLKGMLPPLDRGVGALLDDLESRGLLDDTLVLMMGEFGRTPKLNKDTGRDHWAPCGFAVWAGAGVRGGQVIGKSDKIGAYPITPPYSPNDLGATVYHVLGIQPETEVRDRQNRPVQLNRGTVIDALFTGAAG
jgi:uncharacterized protein (DUF1501 family)